MSYENIKNMLAELSSEELLTLMNEVRNASASSSMVSSIKSIFQNGYLLEFKDIDGNSVLAGELITSEPTSAESVRLSFNIYGFPLYQFIMDLDISDKWNFTTNNYSFDFESYPTSYLMIDENEIRPFLAVKSVGVCRLVHGLNNTSNIKVIDNITNEESGINNDNVSSLTVPGLISNSLKHIQNWLSNDSHRVVLDVSRVATKKEGRRTFKSKNNFSFSFNGIIFDEENPNHIKFYYDNSDDSYYVIDINEFEGGNICWNDEHTMITINNKDKTYNINIKPLSDKEGYSKLPISIPDGLTVCTR